MSGRHEGPGVAYDVHWTDQARAWARAWEAESARCTAWRAHPHKATLRTELDEVMRQLDAHATLSSRAYMLIRALL